MKLTALLPNVLPFVKNCPRPVAAAMLRKAAIEFCEKTLVWSATLSITSADIVTHGDVITDTDGLEITDTDGEPIYATVEGSVEVASRYVMPFPGQSCMVKLQAYLRDGEEGDVVDPDTGESLKRNGSGIDAAWTEDRVNLNVTPAPAEEGILFEVKVALRPTEDATEIPDELGNYYADALADGAMARLYEMPDQPWSDPARAVSKRDEFNSAIKRTAARVSKGFSRGGHQVKPFTI